MPIKGLSEIRRIPRVGKLRLGVRDISRRTGREYPRAVDFFVVDPEDGITSPAAAEAFYSQYGGRPREIDIMFPCDDPGQFFPQWLKRYGSGSGLVCKGDGETAHRVNRETGGLVEVPCDPEECPSYNASPPQCRRVASLHVLLIGLPGCGVWVCETASYHSIVNLNSAVAFIRTLTGGRIAMIPLKLRLKPQEVAPGGRKKIVYVLDLAHDRIQVEDILRAAGREPGRRRRGGMGDVQEARLTKPFLSDGFTSERAVRRAGG